MSELRHLERSRSLDEVTAERPGRAAPPLVGYYHRRAETHRAMAARAMPEAAAVHRALVAAYLAAATAAERGETVDFAGSHRAGQQESSPTTDKPAAADEPRTSHPAPTGQRLYGLHKPPDRRAVARP